MSLQYCNKSKSQLTSPTPAQAASCCIISGTYSMYLVVFYVGEYVWVCVCGCVYKIENFRTLSAPSEIASLREAISSSAAFE
jgi:hypothetical protein